MDVLMRGAMAAAALFPICQDLSPSPPLALLRPLPPADLRLPQHSFRRSILRRPFSSSPSSAGLSSRHSCRSSSPLRASEGGEPVADESRFLDEDGVVNDMDGYLNYLSLEYDSVWDTKPSWSCTSTSFQGLILKKTITYGTVNFFLRCQPWTIVLTGVMVTGCSWAILHSVIITAVISCLICAWWFIFLYAYPKAYEDMIAQRRQNVVSGVEDTFGVRKTQ